MIDDNNDILLLITEAFGLDIGLGQIAHHRLCGHVAQAMWSKS